MIRRNKVSVVVVNFKQLEYLKAFIDSLNILFVYNSYDVELIIVDNSGEVDQQEVQGDNLFSVTVLKKGNIGYLKGLVEGMKYSQKNNPDVFILCNPDIVFETSITKKDFEIIKANGIVAPYVYDLSGVSQNPNRKNRMSKTEQLIWSVMTISYEVYSSISLIKEGLKNIIKASKAVKKAPKESIDSFEIYLPHGCCMFVDSGLAEKANLFDEDIFLWGEEAVIAGKCRENGGRVWFQSSIKVKHFSHTSTGFISEREKFNIWKQSFQVYRRYLNK